MERHVLRTACITLLAVTLAGCAGSGAILEVLRGNFSYSRGDYQGALVHYMVAMEDQPLDTWTRYNIGNVYYALGEHAAALEIWGDARASAEAASDTGNAEMALIYATSYNRGVLMYQQGGYEKAYEEFRYALAVNARSAEAKANLELALGKMQDAEAAAGSGQGASGAGVSPAPGDDGQGPPGEQTLRVLEYVRRKEAQQWFANRDLEVRDQPRDW